MVEEVVVEGGWLRRWLKNCESVSKKEGLMGGGGWKRQEGELGGR